MNKERRFTVHIPADVHKLVKMHCANKEMTMSEFFLCAYIEKLERDGVIEKETLPLRDSSMRFGVPCAISHNDSSLFLYSPYH